MKFDSQDSALMKLVSCRSSFYSSRAGRYCEIGAQENKVTGITIVAADNLHNIERFFCLNDRTAKRLPLDQVLHVRVFRVKTRDHVIHILQYRESFRLVLFPSRDLFSWKHKLEVKEDLLSEDIPRSAGLCTLSCFKERVSAGTAKSIFDAIIIGFKHLEVVSRYVICFHAPQYILRNLLCSKT